MRILILAAGYGTRLYPLTLEMPKPLIKINNKPIINFLMDKILYLEKYFKIEEVRVVTNNKFYNNFLDWKNIYKINAKIFNDGTNSPHERLGAIKDIQFAIENTKDNWLILGGDNLFEDSLVEFLKFSQKNKPCVTIGVCRLENKSQASRFGIVDLDINGCILRFEEKPKIPFSDLAASCIYFFPKDSLYLLDEFINSKENADASGKYISWLVKNNKVFGYILKGKWFDIGHFETLKIAEKEFLIKL
ncbi:MAG: nucleotidyltransferase family protein [Candidatus Omnitrophica bacterium]|nr:nucleotidyltransferase family protein [Candidatus Omnitrophota bacterium]